MTATWNGRTIAENTHGVREYNLLKSRIVRFLHQELSYEVLAFESALYQCYDADRTAGEVPAFNTLTGCAFGTWHTEGVQPLFEYLRETRAGDHPLFLAGIDVQPIGRNKDDRPQFLFDAVSAYDASYAEEVFALDTRFLEVYARGGRGRREYFRQDEGLQMAKDYDRLESFLVTQEDAAPDARVARRVAASMAWYIRQQSAPDNREYVERRDRGMADNLTFLREELYPDRKIIVWGHNFHLRHDNFSIPPVESMFPDVAARSMGSWAHERHGEELYTVGLYAYRGQSVDNGGEVFDIEPAAPDSLEGMLHELGREVLFVDLSQGGVAPWMNETVTARYNGETPLEIVPRDQYDAVLFVDVATPRISLY